VVQCPRCESDDLCKAGFDGKQNQLLLCKRCLRRFQVKVNIGPKIIECPNSMNQLPDRVVSFTNKKPLNLLPLKRSKDVTSHELPIAAKTLNSFTSYNRQQRTAEMQQQTQTKNAQNGMVKQEFRGILLQFMFYMKKQGFSESTITTRAGSIRALYYKGADLFNPESVKEAVAFAKTSDGTKHNRIVAYRTFCKFTKIDCGELPKYSRNETSLYVPKESKLDILIAGAGWKTGAFLQLLKETGARTVEASRLKWEDVDTENKLILIANPAKKGKPRTLKVSEKCIEMLMRLPKKNKYVFGENARKRMRSNFSWTRKHIAMKTANKNLLRIHLRTFRHFFGTKLYLQTRDICFVQKKLGHRSITSTTVYENSDAREEVEQYTIKAVSSKEDAVKLGELGYESFDEIDGIKLYRKRLINW